MMKTRNQMTAADRHSGAPPIPSKAEAMLDAQSSLLGQGRDIPAVAESPIPDWSLRHRTPDPLQDGPAEAHQPVISAAG